MSESQNIKGAENIPTASVINLIDTLPAPADAQGE